jgi:hypothetical protein
MWGFKSTAWEEFENELFVKGISDSDHFPLNHSEIFDRLRQELTGIGEENGETDIRIDRNW